MTTPTLGAGYLATVDGYAIPDPESDDTTTPARFTTAAEAAASAEAAATDAANWFGLPDVTTAAVPATDYVPPAASPAPAPLTPADLDQLDKQFPAPPTRISHTFAIRMADGELYCSETDRANDRPYTVWTDRAEAETAAAGLTTQAKTLGLVRARFDVVTRATVTAVTAWHL